MIQLSRIVRSHARRESISIHAVKQNIELLMNGLITQSTRYFITAGSKNEEVAADSTFAQLFLQGLEGDADFFNQGIISADALGIYLGSQVASATKRVQTPQFRSIGNAYQMEGKFFF